MILRPTSINTGIPPPARFVLRACSAELFRVHLPAHSAPSGRGCAPEEE